MYSIKKETLESIIIAAKNVYPNEFFSFIGGKNKTITELVIVPATYGDNFCTYRLDLVPHDKTIMGTVHSHPSIYNTPSKADLDSFRKKGKIHLIIGYPYDLNKLKAFDNTGKEILIQVI